MRADDRAVDARPFVPRTNAFTWMDVARALAAGVVVLNHVRDLLLRDYAGQPFSLPFYFASGLGHAGVVVFFVLSGFWITKTVDGRRGQENFWSRYLIDRVSRLGVVLVPVLLIGGVLDAVGLGLDLPLHRGLIGAHSLVGDVGERLGARVLAANLTSFQGLSMPTWGSNGPLWSLAYEWWFYLWFPALALTVWRRRPSWALPFLVLGAMFPALLVGFACWLTGSLLYAAVKTERGWHRAIAARPRLALGATGALLLGGLALARVRPGGGADLLLAAVFGLFLLALCLADPPVWRAARPVARYGADSSYSLYAIHYPVAAILIGPIVGAERWASTPAGWAVAAGLIGVLVAVGWLLSTVTERRTGRVRAGLKRLGGLA